MKFVRTPSELESSIDELNNELDAENENKLKEISFGVC